MIVPRAALDGPVAAAARATMRSPRAAVWSLGGVAAGIGLANLPLFDVLGFELALVAAVYAALAGVDLGAAMTRRLQRDPSPPLALAAPPLGLVAALALRAAWLGTLVALPIGIVAAIHGIWTPTCDWWFGIEAYLAMPVASAILFAGLGVAVALVTGPRPILGNLAPFGAVLVIALWGVWRFYAAPPVFTYNPIIGYFPGNLYDEDVSLGAPVLWSRLETLAWVIGVLALCAARLDAPRFRVGLRAVRPHGLRALAWTLAALGLAGGLTLRLASGRLGHGIDADDIARELGGHVETAHFVIDYARTAEIERDLPIIVADHEFRYAQVVARLGASIDGKIHSYYFASAEQKAAWMGARTVEMAKPWRREIYLDHKAFPHSSLRHEIAHVVAGAFGDRIFAVSTRSRWGVPIPVPGLIEGLAVAVDWPGGYDRTITPHQAMRVMQVMHVQPAVDDLLSLRFLTFSSQASYSTAGSFLRFLLDRHGAAALRALYASGGDFARAYGARQSELVGQWRDFLAGVTIPPQAVEANRERFTRGGVFDRPCPHATAVRRERAGELAASGDRRGAIALMRVVCSDQPEETRHRLDLAAMLAGGEPPELDEARGIWRGVAGSRREPTSVRADALLALATDAASRGAWDEVWRHVLAGLTLSVDDGQRRQFVARLLALSYPGPAGPALRYYFFGASTGAELAVMAFAVGVDPGLGLAHYLYALRLLETGQHAAGARQMVQALDAGLPSTLFVRTAARRLAVAAYRAQDPAAVERACVALTDPAMSEMDRLLAADWRERLVFDATGALPAAAATSR